MRIQDLSDESRLDLIALSNRKEWALLEEVLNTRKEGKVRELVAGSTCDERNRGRIEEMDFIIGLRELLVNRKNNG